MEETSQHFPKNGMCWQAKVVPQSCVPPLLQQDENTDSTNCMASKIVRPPLLGSCVLGRAEMETEIKALVCWP